jgi:hypothetical protein
VVAPAPEKVVVAPAPEKVVVAPPPEKVVVAPPPEKTVVASTSEIVVVAPAPDKAASQPQRNPDEITTSALSRSDPPLRSFDRPAPSSDNLAQADRLVAKGEDYLARGDIAVARRYFERAAELGLPIAALRMAETQDPRELARRGRARGEGQSRRGQALVSTGARTQRAGSRLQIASPRPPVNPTPDIISGVWE